jgi:hypothetical protein
MLIVDSHALSCKVESDSNVQISFVAKIWLARKVARDGFILANDNGFGKIKNGLLPVGVLAKGRRRESNGFVCLCKGTFKVGNQSVNVIIPMCTNGKGYRKRQIVRGASENVQL